MVIFHSYVSLPEGILGALNGHVTQELSRTHRVSHLAVELEQPRWRQFTLIWFRLCRLLQNKKKRGWEKLEEQNKCWKLLTRKLCFNPKLFFSRNFSGMAVWLWKKQKMSHWQTILFVLIFGGPWRKRTKLWTTLTTHEHCANMIMYTQRNRPTTPSNKKERSPATDTQICMQRFEHARDTTSYFEMVEYLLSHHRFRHPQKKNKTATEHTNKNKEQQYIYIYTYISRLSTIPRRRDGWASGH